MCIRRRDMGLRREKSKAVALHARCPTLCDKAAKDGAPAFGR
jgi:hypothetical protein